MKAIVLTWDRHRVITEHMILQYERLWPDHPFRFRIPFQKLAGSNSERIEYVQAPGGSPADIPATVLKLIDNLDAEEWVYWCSDDKYPIRLVAEKFSSLFEYARSQADMSGLLCCRCRITLEQPDVSLFPGARVSPAGDVFLERRRWYQIWIHQFLRVKVLRHLFMQMPKDIPSAKALDKLKNSIPKPDELRLFVTEKNYAVFGESTQRGTLTQNCYNSIRKTDLELPHWLRRPNGKHVTMGELPEPERWSWSKLRHAFHRGATL